MDFLPRIVAETSSMASWTSPLLMTSELTSARRPLYLNKEESYLDKGRVVKFKATQALRERLDTHKIFTKDQCFHLHYHKFSIKSYVLDVY